jgi:hypothetical protein
LLGFSTFPTRCSPAGVRAGDLDGDLLAFRLLPSFKYGLVPRLAAILANYSLRAAVSGGLIQKLCMCEQCSSLGDADGRNKGKKMGLKRRDLQQWDALQGVRKEGEEKKERSKVW